MKTLAIIGVIAAVAIALPALWCAVLLALSFVGGWHALAASYGARELLHGMQFTGESGFVGGDFRSPQNRCDIALINERAGRYAVRNMK